MKLWRREEMERMRAWRPRSDEVEVSQYWSVNEDILSTGP